MDIDSLTKTAATLFGIFGVGKIFYDVVLGKRAKLRDEYKFAKEFLDDLDKNPKMNPYLREKGFQAIAGDTTLSAEDVQHLITLQDADKRLKAYRLSKRYLDDPKFENDKVVHFKDKYLHKYRLFLKVLYVSLYVICALIAVSPYLLKEKFGLNSNQALIAVFTTFPLFGYFALDFLREFICILQAEDIVKNQIKNKNKKK